MDLMTPLRRRGKAPSAGRKPRRPEFVDAAWALARDRIGGKAPAARKPKRKRVLLIGAGAAALAAVTGALLKMKARVAGGEDEGDPTGPAHHDGAGSMPDGAVEPVGAPTGTAEPRRTDQ